MGRGLEGLLRIVSGLAVVALAAQLAAAQGPPQGRGGFVAYPPRTVDAAASARGKTLYSLHCTFCHGSDAHGGDGGGPSLLRSLIVLDDKKGELIGPIVKNGSGAMLPINLTDAQISDLAEFLHSFPIASRTEPSTRSILVGNAREGEAFVVAKCASCHTVDTLKAFAAKLKDDRTLQQMWLMPGSGGRGGRGGSGPAIPAPPVTVTVTMPSGQKVEGTLVRMDDFGVSLRDAGGAYQSFNTFGTAITVDVKDPLAGHKALLPIYRDADIHNVTAYLASLR